VGEGALVCRVLSYKRVSGEAFQFGEPVGHAGAVGGGGGVHRHCLWWLASLVGSWQAKGDRKGSRVGTAEGKPGVERLTSASLKFVPKETMLRSRGGVTEKGKQESVEKRARVFSNFWRRWYVLQRKLQFGRRAAEGSTGASDIGDADGLCETGMSDCGLVGVAAGECGGTKN